MSPDKRVLAVSDPHGHPTILKKLLKMANYDSSIDQLILLGDYIDRGPDAVGMMNLVEELTQEGAIALAGNHEHMLIYYMNDVISQDEWFYNGGNFTLMSYLELGMNMDKVMTRHLRFIGRMPLMHETDDYIFVHAGINPRMPLDKQDHNDLLWIREDFLDHPTGLDKIVVFGHTPTFTRGHAGIMSVPGKINIDTGAGQGRAMSLLELPSGKVHSIGVTTKESISYKINVYKERVGA